MGAVHFLLGNTGLVFALETECMSLRRLELAADNKLLELVGLRGNHAYGAVGWAAEIGLDGLLLLLVAG